MNRRLDACEPCLTLLRLLSRADQCRVIDVAVSELGGYAPVPEFESVRDEAEEWVAEKPNQVKAHYLVAIFDSFSPDERRKTIDFLSARMKEDDGEPPA